jgi:hypothetical protein
VEFPKHYRKQKEIFFIQDYWVSELSSSPGILTGTKCFRTCSFHRKNDGQECTELGPLETAS